MALQGPGCCIDKLLNIIWETLPWWQTLNPSALQRYNAIKGVSVERHKHKDVIQVSVAKGEETAQDHASD
jgi:hypothetical protein